MKKEEIAEENEQELIKKLEAIKKKKEENNPDQEQMMIYIANLQNNGIYRANMLQILEKNQSILIDLGKQLLSRLDELNFYLKEISGIKKDVPKQKDTEKMQDL